MAPEDADADEWLAEETCSPLKDADEANDDPWSEGEGSDTEHKASSTAQATGTGPASAASERGCRGERATGKGNDDASRSDTADAASSTVPTSTASVRELGKDSTKEQAQDKDFGSHSSCEKQPTGSDLGEVAIPVSTKGQADNQPTTGAGECEREIPVDNATKANSASSWGQGNGATEDDRTSQGRRPWFIPPTPGQDAGGFHSQEESKEWSTSMRSEEESPPARGGEPQLALGGWINWARKAANKVEEAGKRVLREPHEQPQLGQHIERAEQAFEGLRIREYAEHVGGLIDKGLNLAAEWEGRMNERSAMALDKIGTLLDKVPVVGEGGTGDGDERVGDEVGEAKVPEKSDDEFCITFEQEGGVRMLGELASLSARAREAVNGAFESFTTEEERNQVQQARSVIEAVLSGAESEGEQAWDEDESRWSAQVREASAEEAREAAMLATERLADAVDEAGSTEFATQEAHGSLDRVRQAGARRLAQSLTAGCGRLKDYGNSLANCKNSDGGGGGGYPNRIANARQQALLVRGKLLALAWDISAIADAFLTSMDEVSYAQFNQMMALFLSPAGLALEAQRFLINSFC